MHANEESFALNTLYRAQATSFSMPKLWKDVLETYGLNLWQRENENSLICQNFQIEAHNSTESKTETGSSTAEPGRGKEMGHVFSASHFQSVLFSNKELKIKGLQNALARKRQQHFLSFPVHSLPGGARKTGRISLPLEKWLIRDGCGQDWCHRLPWYGWGASSTFQRGKRNLPRLWPGTKAQCCHWGFPLGLERGMNQALMTQGFKGSPRLAGLHRYRQGWEQGHTSQRWFWDSGEHSRNVPHNCSISQHPNQDFLSDLLPVTPQSWKSIIFAPQISNSGTRTSAVQLCPVIIRNRA